MIQNCSGLNQRFLRSPKGVDRHLGHYIYNVTSDIYWKHRDLPSPPHNAIAANGKIIFWDSTFLARKGIIKSKKAELAFLAVLGALCFTPLIWIAIGGAVAHLASHKDIREKFGTKLNQAFWDAKTQRAEAVEQLKASLSQTVPAETASVSNA